MYVFVLLYVIFWTLLSFSGTASSAYRVYKLSSDKATNEAVSTEFIAPNDDCVWPTSVVHGFVQILSADDDAVVNSTSAKSGSRAIYQCATGFLIANGSVMTCVDGIWQGDVPICHLIQPSDHCQQPPTVSDAQPYFGDGSKLNEEEMDFAHDIKIIYICNHGYSQQGSSPVTCKMGEWIGQGPKCLREEKYCNSSPPELVHGDYSLHGKETFSSKKFPPGLSAFYYCMNGYRLKDIDFSILTCTDGFWKGSITSCIPRTSCDPPMDIKNGNWLIKSLYPDYRIGIRVLYECDEGFKAVGATEIVCQAPGYWSDYGPQCLPLDLYCTEPEPAVNGFFMCKPSHCNFFQIGTEVHHICNKNFEPLPLTIVVQTCMSGGMWSGEKPRCLLVNYATTYGYSLNANSVNSVTVVVSTACGVLGLLISIIAIVVIKHCRKRCRYPYPTSLGSSSPLDYSGHHRNDDHDCEAFIPCVDFAYAIAPTLPTYEEAITSNSSCSPTTVSLTSSTRPSFRTLPGSRTVGTIISFQHGTALLQSDPRRNSVTTVSSSTMCTDNGSVETVDASDVTSTSATVGTGDSLASNPSLAVLFHLAACSIDLSFANESLTVNMGENAVAVCRDHPKDCFHLNESHSESTPILKIPEEGNDD